MGKEHHERKQRVRSIVRRNPGKTAVEIRDSLNLDETPYGALRELVADGAIRREDGDDRPVYHPPNYE